ELTHARISEAYVRIDDRVVDRSALHECTFGLAAVPVVRQLGDGKAEGSAVLDVVVLGAGPCGRWQLRRFVRLLLVLLGGFVGLLLGGLLPAGGERSRPAEEGCPLEEAAAVGAECHVYLL